MLDTVPELDKETNIGIFEEVIDNPGQGNCGFYAFAIGLIHIIQQEHPTGLHEVANTWVTFDPSIAGLYARIGKYNFRKPDKDLLQLLQTSLRNLAFTAQILELPQACAAARDSNNYGPLAENDNFIVFASLYHGGNRADLDPRYNEFASSQLIMTKIAELKNQGYIADPQAANLVLGPLFMRLLYGDNVDLNQINPITPFNANSPIIEALEMIGQKNWGRELDMNALARVFNFNIHILIDGEPIQPFVSDIPNRHTITLINENNSHWKTELNSAVAISNPTQVNKIITDFILKPCIPRPNNPADQNPLPFNMHRAMQLALIDKKLKILGTKIKKFSENLNEEKYALACEAANRLKSGIEDLVNRYKLNSIDLDALKAGVNGLLKNGLEETDDVKTLGIHRGWKQDVYNILAAVLFLGLAHLVHRCHTGKWSLFHTKTDSTKQLEILEEDMEGLRAIG